MRKRTAQDAIRALHGARLADTPTRKAPNSEEVYDIRALVSSEELASDGGIILTTAWQLDAYRRRPLFIAGHDLGGLNPLNRVALGRAVSIGTEEGLPAVPNGRGLVAYLRFATTEFAREIRVLYTEGALSDFSIRWDWRSERLRAPSDEERERFGEQLSWIAESVELVEISSVALGADPGVGVLRGDVEAALERCRAAGRKLPIVERMLTHRGRVAVTRAAAPEPAVDVLAAASVIDVAKQNVAALHAWLDAVGPLRQELSDTLTALANLVAAAQPDDAVDADLKLAALLGGAAVNITDFEALEPDQESAAMSALADLTAALGQFDVTFRDVGPAVVGIGNALAKVAATLGLAPLAIGDGDRIDIAAILADRGQEELRVDLDAILADKRDQAGAI